MGRTAVLTAPLAAAPLAAALLAAAFLAANDAPGTEEPDPVLLGAGTDSIVVPERALSSGAYLGGDRWIVVAPDEGAVRLIELGARDSAAPFGSGAEFQHPHFVFSDADTVYI